MCFNTNKHLISNLSCQFNGLVQDCSNSIANAMVLLQSCTNPSNYSASHMSHTPHIPSDSAYYETKLFNSLPPSAKYICVSELGTIGSGDGLSPVRHQAITWTNAVLLSIRLLGMNFSEIWIETQNFSFMKMHLKMLSVKWRPFCPGTACVTLWRHVRMGHKGDPSFSRRTVDRCAQFRRFAH